MDKILVIGVDTVAGANLALTLAEKYNVATWHPEDKFDIANCDALDPDDAPRTVVEHAAPDWVIYCGPAANSTWDFNSVQRIDERIVDQARKWAAACQAQNARFVMISSDGVFTGPWMFHEENSIGICQSAQAVAIRSAEEAVLEAAPAALIIRTNTYGWSADPTQNGWIENLISEVEVRRFVEQDSIRHATPILATDLAAILERACQENLSGTFHVAGAERINPQVFTQRLADQLELPWLAVRKETSLTAPPKEFGAGESSLQTKEIRKALCVAMPLVTEGLQRLIEQSTNGYQEKLIGNRGYKVVSRAA